LGIQNIKSRLGVYNSKLFLYGCLITLSLAVVAIFSPSFVQSLNNKSYDLMLRTLPQPAESKIPVIVGIDDLSLTEYGQWPWPRYILARLLKKIDHQGASAIGLDMILPEPDRTSLSVVLGEMRKEKGVKFSKELPIKQQYENDQVLADVLRNAPVVLAYQFKFGDKSSSKDSDIHPLKYVIKENTRNKKCGISFADNVIHSLPLLTRAAGASGFVNSLTDSDGVIRRVPLVMDYKGVFYPSLAMATLIKAYGNDQVMIETGADGFSIDWNDRRIPLDCRGFFLVHYLWKDNALPYVSAADILSDRIKPEIFKHKVVFVGVNASGTGDGHITPLGKMVTGTEVNASIVNSIITQNFIQRPAWATGAELALMVAAGIVSSIALAAGGALWCLLFTLIAGITTGAMFYWLFMTHGIFLSPVIPISALLVNFVVLNTIKYRLEELKVHKSSLALIQLQDVVILSLSALAETRDEETGHHILRTQRYVQTLAKHLQRSAKYKKILTDHAIELLYKSAPLHDIGKVGIPDRILQKPCKLTEEEYEQIKTHAVRGGQTIQKTGDMLGGKVDFQYLKCVYEVVVYHHEKWDGSGYPYGLAGESIPLTARLMALADVYDALISRRVYKPAFPPESAHATILEGRGRHFDPDIVDAFIEEEAAFLQIAREFADKE
jgi:adenylate cyclase